MKTRAGWNRALLGIYILIYVFVSASILSYYYMTFLNDGDRLNFAIQFSFVLAVVLYCAGAPVVIAERFPRTLHSALLLFLPYLINSIYFITTRSSNTTILQSMVIDSIVTVSGVVIGLVSTVIVEPWHGERRKAGPFFKKFLYSMKYKVKYIKKNLFMLIPAVILCYPLVSLGYLLSEGAILSSISGWDIFPLWINRSIYFSGVFHVSFFYYKEMRTL